MGDGIADEIVQNPLCHRDIRQHALGLCRRNGEFNTSSFCRRPMLLNDVVEQLSHDKRLDIRLFFTGIQGGQFEQLLNLPAQPVCF